MSKLDDIASRNRAARKRDTRRTAYALGFVALIALVIVLYECTTAFEPNLPPAAKPAPAERLHDVPLGAPRTPTRTQP